MGKRKKRPGNIVKVELDDALSGIGEAIPIVVKQSSKDGRRVQQTVHQVPTPRQHQIPSTFDPSPAVTDDWDCVFPGIDDPVDEPEGPESVRSCSLSWSPS